MRLLLTICVTLPFAIATATADARVLEHSQDVAPAQLLNQELADFRMAKQAGMTLSEATESVRRQTGGTVLSAQTKVSGGRETHHIKVLLKDGKVKTVKVAGRKVSGG